MLEREEVRLLSAAVFGNRYLIEVVSAIATLTSAESAVPITVRMISLKAGLADNLVRLVVTRLSRAGLLQPLAQERPRGPLHHAVARNDERWAALVELCERLDVG